MHFAVELPWWALVLAVTAVATLAWFSYARPLVSLTPFQRGTLVGLRGLVLIVLLFLACRPTVLRSSTSAEDAVVALVVDVSRSMRLADAGGETRIARATALVRGWLPALRGRFRPEVLAAGDSLTPAAPDRLAAESRQSNLTGALTAVRERYRGQAIAGIILVSDGGNTGAAEPGEELASGPPVYVVGVGSPDGPRDREILGVDAGDTRLDQAAVDVRVSMVSTGFGRDPFEVRLLQNGRLVESRRIAPQADGVPLAESFTVLPDLTQPTVYAAEIPASAAESVSENNARSVLISPAGRKRRVLVVAGAPGFEHTFVMRELARDRSFEVDSVVRKGENDQGRDTFLVQADAGRLPALVNRFPSSREGLYSYDAVVLANLEGDFLTSDQLAMMADFVAARGGGLLVFGGRSFGSRGFVGTPLEAALPVELDDRRGGDTTLVAAGQESVVLTLEGEHHPVMRIGTTREESRRIWAALPALAASAPLGGPRPGATVLAATRRADSGAHPLVAVQRYGQGRSMVFTGEASWRWKMLMPSTDRTHEIFWRGAVRWLAAAAPDPVTIVAPEAAEPGDLATIDVLVRDRAFAPVGDATLSATLTGPGGNAQPLALVPARAAAGRYTAAARLEAPGVHRVHVDARRGSTLHGTADRWFYVGSADREFANPRLNEGFLRRVARRSGGEYFRAADAARVVESLRPVPPAGGLPAQRELWHEPWAYAVVVVLLSAEWTLRRRWGLR